MAERNISKNVKFLNKDFISLRNSLLDFTKIYFPNTYQNFNESSTGMMFLELTAYVGDVLSYYIDNSLKESLLFYAEEERNIFSIAQALGYKPKLSYPASTTVDVFQIIPVTGTGADIGPDWRYALTIDADSQVSSEENSSVVFRTLEPVNFKVSSSIDPTEITVYEVDSVTNIPTFYILRKNIKVAAGSIKEAEFAFTSPEKFDTVLLPDENIIDIIDATDTDGNKWYHVPFLAQDTVFVEVENVAANDPELSQYSDDVPYLLKLQKTAKRFTSRILADRTTQLQFGSGISDSPDELIIPNPTNIGSSVFGSVSFSDNPIDPANFLHTKTYGEAPASTTLTVKYLSGGGLESNVNQADLTILRGVKISIDEGGLDSTLLQQVKDSVAMSNPEAATGGREGESVDEIRHNALANFSSQLRMVNKEDFITRIYSMPARFGAIAKAYVVQDDQLNASDESSVNVDENGVITRQNSLIARPVGFDNPLALNAYILGFDKDRKLTTLNEAVKENLKVYLSQYRMMTDAINIKNGFVINFAVKFEIIVFRNYTKREVVLLCIEKIKEFFDIDKWQFNQPIIISDLYRELHSVEGVQAIVSLDFENRYNADEGYSGNIYDIPAATRDNIIYPSMDPSIWELKFPNTDIQGRAL